MSNDLGKDDIDYIFLPLQYVLEAVTVYFALHVLQEIWLIFHLLRQMETKMEQNIGDLILLAQNPRRIIYLIPTHLTTPCQAGNIIQATEA